MKILFKVKSLSMTKYRERWKDLTIKATCVGNCGSPGSRWWCLFVLSVFPRHVLDEILDLIESVSEGFPTDS